MKVVLSSTVALPKDSIDVEFVKEACTYRHMPMGEKEPTLVEGYREDGSFLYVPRQYGIQFAQDRGWELEDQTSRGTSVEFRTPPKPRDYQVPVLDEIDFNFQHEYDFMFRARTGFGKTISTLIIAARLGVTTLIVVDQENLRDQWVESLVTHFGYAREEVGIIQGKKLDYVGKHVTIAMVHTLTRKRFPQEVYDYFGFLVVDEVHFVGAPTFSQVLLDFSATYRLGVSATPKRGDGLQKALDNNLGKVRVYVEDAHDDSSVLVAENPTVYSWYANISPKVGRFISEVSEDGARNLLVAELALMLYESGRDTLILSDRIEQLQWIRDLLYYMGAPEQDIGVYAGQSYVYRIAKDVKPARKPRHLERNAEYTPVSLQVISIKTPTKVLAEIKDKAKILSATYQKFAKGVDVPRLAAGVDATPRSKSEQMQGRILRTMPGKKKPIWATIVDVASYRSIYTLLGRIPEYARNNSRFYRVSPDGSTETWHELKKDMQALHRRVKSMRIEPGKDGLNTLQTNRELLLTEPRSASATVKPSASAHRVQSAYRPPAPRVPLPTQATRKAPSSQKHIRFLRRRAP